MTITEITKIRFECIRIVKGLQKSVNLIDDATKLERFITFSDNEELISNRIECAKLALSDSNNVTDLIENATRINNYLGVNTANMKP